jgi:hypothetical protein
VGSISQYQGIFGEIGHSQASPGGDCWTYGNREYEKDDGVARHVIANSPRMAAVGVSIHAASSFVASSGKPIIQSLSWAIASRRLHFPHRFAALSRDAGSLNGAPFACTPYSKDALGNDFRDVREAFDPTAASSSPTSGAVEAIPAAAPSRTVTSPAFVTPLGLRTLLSA